MTSLGQERRGKRPSSHILIGRDTELELLVELATRPPALVVVTGEAGVGKSRLVREMVERPEIAGRRVLTGRCHPLREPFPLGPVVEVLRALAGEVSRATLSDVAGALRELVPELAPQLPPAPAPTGDPRAERHRVFRAVRELLGAAGRGVCVLEDVHWADEGTFELLSFLVADPPPSLSLVLTGRPGLMERASILSALHVRSPRIASTARIDVSPLDAENVQKLASAILATEISAEAATVLRHWTAGIPFAIEEVLALTPARDDVHVNGCRWMEEPPAVPPAVGDPVVERMRSLSRDGQLVARSAAVLARPADEALIRRVAGLAPARCASALTAALSVAVLEECGDASYGCRHALATQALYGAMPGPERTRLHLRAARALEARPEPRHLFEIAYHFKRADRREAWLRYAEAAADAAAGRGDDRTAAEVFADTLASGRLGRAATRRLALKLGSAALYGRIPGNAITVLRATLDDESLSTGVRGELRLALARLLLIAGDGVSAEQVMIRAASELRRRPVLAARAMALLAEMRPAQGGPHEQRVWLDAALRAVSRRGEPAVKIQVRAARAQFLLERGDPTAWRDVEALPWSAGADEERLELVRASKYLARAALGLGHYRRAEYVLDRGESIRDALDHMRFATGLASMRAWLEWRTGRWEGLEVRARNLIQASTGAPGTSVGNESIVGWLLLARGELDEAADRFAAILETIRRAPQARLLGPVMGALATIHLAGEDPDAARELAEVGIAEIRERGLWVSASALAPVAVDALIAVGATSDAGELVRDFSRGVRGRDAPAARAALDHCRGSLAEARGRRDRAVSAFAQSERAWRALPSPYDAARARIRRGRCLLAPDQRVGADCLVGALEELHALGASRDATAVREELRAQGVRLPPPWGPGRRSYGEELSPREVEVARLAARGHTNQEIAGELIVSVRTVEKHVSAVLRKLELESREAIAERLAQKR